MFPSSYAGFWCEILHLACFCVCVCVFLSKLLFLCLPIASVIIYVKLCACDLFNLFPLDYAGFLCEFNNLLVFVFLFLSRLLFLYGILGI